MGGGAGGGSLRAGGIVGDGGDLAHFVVEGESAGVWVGAAICVVAVGLAAVGLTAAGHDGH